MIAVVGFISVAALLKNYRAILLVVVASLALPVIVGIAVLLSPRMLNAFEARLTSTHNVNNSKGRIADLLMGGIPPTSDPIGVGIGYGVDGSHAGEVGSYDYTYQLSEQDLPRNYMELGVIAGSLYVAWRVLFCLGLVLISIKLAIDEISPHALPLSLVVFTTAYVTDWTRNSTMTSTQMFLAASFILGAFYFQDYASPKVQVGWNFRKRFL